MTSKERVLSTLEFRGPDRIPVDLWILPAAKMEYGKDLDDLCSSYERDIVSFSGPFDHGFTPEYYQVGTFIDPWGSKWSNIQAGIIGEVKEPIFRDYSKMVGYTVPIALFKEQWNENLPKLNRQLNEARKDGKFIIGGWISLFERLQYLRGTEDLYCDIPFEEPEMLKMIQMVMDFYEVYLDCWLATDIDGVAFGDDWGTQISLLISLESWRKLFKLNYQKLINKIKASGKKVFFHSDGYIYDLYPELIEMGVDAVNSQLWCMGVEKVAEKYAGKITFWGEISRQDILPNGTPDDVRNAASKMINCLYKNGGLIGQSEINRDVPFKNIKTVLEAWYPEK